MLREQVKAGVIEDLTAVMDQAWQARFVPAAMEAYTLQGKVYGVPMHTSQVGFFYNKDLFAKAGVDASAIKTWDDLLVAVKQELHCFRAPQRLIGIRIHRIDTSSLARHSRACSLPR